MREFCAPEFDERISYRGTAASLRAQRRERSQVAPVRVYSYRPEREVQVVMVPVLGGF
jgi:hypothetical protein